MFSHSVKKEVLPVETATIPSIDVHQLKQRMECESGLLLIDCREEDEYGQGHIKGSTLMPLSGLRQNPQSALSQLKRAKSPIVVHCRSGKRSLAAIELFTQILDDGPALYNLEGGILAWQKAGLPVE